LQTKPGRNCSSSPRNSHSTQNLRPQLRVPVPRQRFPEYLRRQWRDHSIRALAAHSLSRHPGLLQSHPQWQRGRVHCQQQILRLQLPVRQLYAEAGDYEER